MRTIPIPTQIKHQIVHSSFVVTFSQCTSSDDSLFGHQWGSITFYKPISDLKYKTTF